MVSDQERSGRQTIVDVAALAKVSPATVSRVLGGTYPVATATRARVMRAVRELDYVANAHARALQGAGTRVIAILLDDISGPSFTMLAAGVEEEASTHGRLCMICTTHSDPAREAEVIDTLRQQGAEAVILVGGTVDDAAFQQRIAHIARSLGAVGSKLVLCGRPVPAGTQAIVVDYDNEGGAFGAVAHLLAAGHRDILHLGGIPGHNTAVARRAGYLRALRSYGIEPRPELHPDGHFDRASGLRLTRAALAAGTRFTAIFASTDLVASGAYAALREAGLDIPGDVSVIGFDDIPLAADLYPALTTVHVPFEELGRTTVRLVTGRRDDTPAHATMGTHVIVRDSVRSPRSAG